MIVKPIDQVPKQEVQMEGAEGVSMQRPIASSDGSPLFSFRVFTIKPGGTTPYHSHEWEHLNFIIEGEGALVDEHEKELPIRKGDFALVLPDEQHCYRNTSEQGDLVMICAVPKEYE